jgi:hypothetical protein
MAAKYLRRFAIQGELSRGVGLCVVFPRRKMGYEPFMIVMLLCFTFVLVPRTRDYGFVEGDDEY